MAHYKLADLYSTRHEELIGTLKSAGSCAPGAGRAWIEEARELVVDNGFNIDKYTVCESLRRHVEAGASENVAASDTMLAAAGVPPAPAAGAVTVGSEVVRRVAGLEMLRHLWLLRKSGNHRLWILSLPENRIIATATTLAA